MKKLTALVLALCLIMTTGSVALADYVDGWLNQRIATRTGPSTRYYEPGSFLRSGDRVIVHSKVWDDRNEIWWVQVEFSSGNERYRAYTGAWRMDVDLYDVPEEKALRTCEVWEDADVFAGPGWEYVMWNDTVYAGTTGTLYEAENGYGLIECWNASKGQTWRVWIDLDKTDCRRDYGNVDTFPEYGSPCYEGWYTSMDEINERNGGSYYDNSYNDDYYYDDDYDYDDGYYTGGDSDIIGQTIRITVGSGNARGGPGSEYGKIATVEYGDYYVVYDTDVASNGVTWFMIYANGHYCWISSGLTNIGKY